MINVMEEAKKLGLGILYIITLIFIIRFFSLGKWEVIGVLCFSNIILMSYTSWKHNTQFSLYDFGKNCIQIILIVHLLRWISSYGMIGWFISIALIVTLILWRKWKQYIEVKQHIESMLFGKPLNEYVKEGKRPPSISIVRKK